jgi:hypothetical protein
MNDETDLQSLAESILEIYAPPNFSSAQIKILAKSEVSRWKKDRESQLSCFTGESRQ